MKKRAPLVLGFIICLSFSTFGQTPSPAPQQNVQPADESDVVRVTTNLIQIDALVTDKQGRVVTNLKPEDFEVLVNGKPQQITNFSFVTLKPQPAEQPAATAKNTNKTTVPLPPVRLRPEQIKRTLALVIDDLTIHCKDMPFVKRAVKKFVDEQMQPDDLVAIVLVGRNVGALQHFTSDKQHLYAAIERIIYNPESGKCGPVSHIEREQDASLESADRDIRGGDNDERFLSNIRVSEALRQTNYVTRGMRALPGRKAVMLFSEGFPLQILKEPEYSVLIREAIKRVVDSAHRAGVVIYTMDSRGLVADELTAADLVGTSMTSRQISGVMAFSMKAFLAPQDGLRNLAEQAGGFAILNSNDYSGAIRKALDDQKSYYLIGYQPDASIFDPTKSRFNQLTIKVKKSGLKVRYRSGFFGIKDENTKPLANTPQQQIMQALSSPFSSGDINLRLTPLFGNDARIGSFVRSLVHISTKDLTFTDKPDGSHEAVINVVAYTFGDNGGVIDSVGETHTITLSDKLYSRALARGLVYSLTVPVKKAGGYQLRVAVRDDKAQKVGSASQFINVPDIGKGRLTLSGIALSSYDPQAEKNSAIDTGNLANGETPGNTVLTQGALRRFRSGHVLQFAYAIYNARLDKGTNPPQLTTQVRLFHEGKEIYAGQETPYDVGGQPDSGRLVAEGGLHLAGIKAGEYILQIVVRDNLVKEKNRATTTGWIDFEVVK